MRRQAPHRLRHLANIFDAGRTFPQDFKKANELYKKACDLGSSSGCNNLGYAYENGRGLTKDERRGLDLYKKACEKGNETSCSNVRYLTQRMALSKEKRASAPAGRRRPHQRQPRRRQRRERRAPPGHRAALRALSR